MAGAIRLFESGREPVLSILERFGRDRSGASSIEYSLIAAFIFIAIVGAVSLVGTNLVPWFQAVADGLN